MRAWLGFIAVFCFFTFTSAAEKGLQDIQSVAISTIDKLGNKKTSYSYQYKILDESGRISMANFRLRFLGEDKNFKAIDIFSYTDKVTTKTSPKDIKISDVQNVSVGITDLKMAIIPIHNLKIGSTVYINYEVYTPAMAPGHMNDTATISNDSLAENEFYYYESDLPLKTLKDIPEKFFSVEEGQKKNNKYYIMIRPTAYAYETAGRNVKSGYVSISTSQSWEQISQYFSPQYKKVWDSKLPPEYQQIVANAAKLKTTSEKIEFAGQEISKLIAYSGTWTNPQNKLIPQDFAKLLKSKTGDCKDYSASLVAVLRALKIEAYPALVYRSNNYSPKLIKDFSTLPQLLAFNHVIVWATDESKKVWWVDPTNPMVFADNISSDILGKFSLVLDGASKDIRFLPESNAIASNSKLELLLKVNEDNTVFGTGKLVLNESSYNSIGQLERLKGVDGLKPVINVLLEPTIKMDVDIVKNKTTRIPSYNFSYVSPQFVLDKPKKYKAIIVTNAAYLPILKIRAEEESNLGEIGEHKSITKILDVKAIEANLSDCYARTPWMDVERVVENKKGYVLVTDTVRTKKKIITKEEATSRSFATELQSLKGCYNANAVYLYIDKSNRTPERVELDKVLGPDVYEMTEKQADDLYAIISDESLSERYNKLLKYYNIKLTENPNDVKAMARKSQLIMGVAGVNARNGVTSVSMLRDSLAINDKALKLNQNKYNKDIYKARIQAKLKLGDLKSAVADLKVYVANEPDKYSSYVMAIDSSIWQKSYPLAEKLGKTALKLSRTPVEKSEVQKRLAMVYYVTKKYPEAIELRQELAKADEKNPWVYHNLAELYVLVSDYDKAIDQAKKSLSLAELPEAKEVLSYAYYQKANLLVKPLSPTTAVKVANGRSPASTATTTGSKYNPEEYEKYLVEAYKWNKKNVNALYKLSMHYINSHELDKNNLSYVSKAKYYSGLLMELEPNHQLTREVVSLTKKISAGVSNEKQ